MPGSHAHSKAQECTVTSRTTLTKDRPSGDSSPLPGSPAELAQQLLRELTRLRDELLPTAERESAFHLARAYLAYAQALAWKDVVLRRDLEAPHRVLLALQLVRPFVDRYYPELDLAHQIAIEVETVLSGLLAAEDALARVRTERRLKDPGLSELEHAVLRVLSRTEAPLRRKQVYEAICPGKTPSIQWVGRVLRELSDAGYLHSTQARAQGNPETAFYSIAVKGRDLSGSAAHRRKILELAIEAKRSSAAVTSGLGEGLFSSQMKGLGKLRPDGAIEHMAEEIRDLVEA